ncbi:MAG TPA: pyridoxamine 5'-phosphate oxidase [Acidimicrobiales bacterium]|nr:pyridoxamine 5'-phosphate oxidase [Acidimicrobiales bacterium]
MPGTGGNSEPLSEPLAAPDPLTQFRRWFDQARLVVQDPEAMAVATVDQQGRPSVRMVLMRSFGEQGFVFHTNYDSRKGTELAHNPEVALLFHWAPLSRQVRVEGPAERIPADESDAYFAGRPRGAQIAAWASHQSRTIGSRDQLDARVYERAAAYAGHEVPRPPWWGGLRVEPRTFEFWQNRDDRLHDRLQYRREPGGWRMERLQP